MNKHHHSSGFSFIELMVVTLLCSLFLFYGITHFSFFDGLVVHTELSKLTAACMYMQKFAIATNSEQYMIFYPERNAYEYAGHVVHLSSMIRFGLLPSVKGPPGSAHKVATKTVTFPGQRICFYPSGIISSGTVYMIDKNKKYQYALSNSVSQVSCLRLYQYDSSWKIIHDSY